MQVDASHGTFPHRMNLQKNSRHDNDLYAQPPPTQPQEKTLADAAIKKEAKENVANAESLETVPTKETADNTEESYNDQESIPYCVKTKPYYSINAKLNQREKVSIPSVNTSSSMFIETGYSDSGMDESAPLSEDQVTPVEDIKPPPIWDANFKFLTSSSASSRTSQTYNKSSVTCLICGKQLSNQYNLRVHMETHSNSSYSCTACSHVSRSRDALRKHVSYRHPVASPQKRPRYSVPKP